MTTCPRCESRKFVSHMTAGEEFLWERNDRVKASGDTRG